MGSQGKGNGKQQSQSLNALARQGSLCGLTLNELQDHLCEPLHSMNLDDLLRNVFPTEEDRFMMIDLESPSPEFISCSDLDRQSSLTLVRAICNKTVDEVWREIQQAQNGFADEQNLAEGSQSTLGEMTLENFLLKAGVVSEGFSKNQNSVICGNAGSVNGSMDGKHGCPQEIHWLQHYHQLSLQQQAHWGFLSVCDPSQPVIQLPILGMDGVSDAGFPETQRTLPSAELGILPDTQTRRRKRMASGEIAEKTVQRKQKRMIKNRESASRSRARKQAYINELENKIAILEEENDRLKKKKELDEMLHDTPVPEPKSRLRRTVSCPF